MLIDLDTANNLELVRSTLDFSTKNSLYGERLLRSMIFVPVERVSGTLGVMNKTHTRMAGRLLRSTILQPVTGKSINGDRTKELIAMAYSKRDSGKQTGRCRR